MRIWCTSDDFRNDLALLLPTDMPPIGNEPIAGDVLLSNFTAVGSGSVVLPDNCIPEGTVIGAMSLVPPRSNFKPWSVYAGIPISYRGPRNRERIMLQVKQLDDYYKIYRR